MTALLRSRGAHEGARPPKSKELPRNPVPDNLAERRQLARNAAQRAVALLQRSSDAFLANAFVQQSGCVSCHQQTLPAVAFGRAQERGLRVDEAALARQLRAQQDAWGRTRDQAYELHEPQPDSPANLGYGLFGLKALGYQPDALTTAMVWYLAQSQRADGSWPAYDRRPPMEEGLVVGTALAVGALRLYPQPLPDPNLERRMARARHWLEEARPDDLNQRAFRLLGLGWAGAPPKALRAAARELAALQRSDGGWAPLPGLESDAWATGHAMHALREAGGIEVDDPVHQRGVAFLLRTQFPDGSWWVPSRTWPFQPHFDSGFPHGKDQWISAGGTAWAVIALLDLVPVTSSRASLPTAQSLMARSVMLAVETPVTPGPATSTTTSDHGPEFVGDILPLFQRSCVDCHSGEKPKGGFRADDLQALLKGGQSGEPALIRGRSDASPMVRMITDDVEDLEMPPLNRRSKYPALTPAEVRQVRAWIDHGAR